MKVDLDVVHSAIIDAMRLPHVGDDHLEQELAEYAKLVGHPNPYYRLFWLLADIMEPSNVVELGCYRGNSSAAFAVGCPTADVLAIDIHREDKDAKARCEYKVKRYPNFDYMNGWTWDDHVVNCVDTYYSPIDILFIDAWHEYQYAKREWDLYSPMLADEALVICDDIFDSVGTTVEMERFWEEISTPYDHFVDTGVHSGVPMGFMRFVR